MSEGKVYRFISKSQHILVITHMGRKMKVKFTTPYNGVSRYNTSDELIASDIRATESFKSGFIKELEAVDLHKKEEAKKPGNAGGAARHASGNATGAARHASPSETKKKPSWMEGSMSRVQQVKPGADATGAGAKDSAQSAAEKQVLQGTASTGQQELQGTASTGQQELQGTASQNETGEQETLFGLKIEEIDNYMDAKAYLRDTLGVPSTQIKTKDQVKTYCEANGIVFPNYTFE